MNNLLPQIPDTTFRAVVGDRAYEIAFRGGQLLLDGEVVQYSFDLVSSGTYLLLVDGKSLPVVIEPQDGGKVRVYVRGRHTDVDIKDERALLLERFGMGEDEERAEREIRAPMPGLVLSILVEAGQQVTTGQGLLVLEAMKMENELRALADGVVKAVHVSPGEAVGKNALLIEFE